MEQTPRYKRILLKLSGEALAGDQDFGLDERMLESIAKQLKELWEAGIETALVVGGGNIWRGLPGSQRGMDRVTADYMGMLATCINALAMQDALEACGVPTNVLSAIGMQPVSETYSRNKALQYLGSGRIVIFSAGTGSPFFSTDTTAALRAAEIGADVILMAKKVDGVYDSDPVTNPDAVRFETLTYSDGLDLELKVMDSTAFRLCLDNDIPIVVFSMLEEGNIMKAAMGENIGTTVGR